MTNEEYNALIRALEVAKEHPGSLGAIIHVAQPHWVFVRERMIDNGVLCANEFGEYNSIKWKNAEAYLNRLKEIYG